MDITIRNIPSESIKKIDEMLQGKSRESYLRKLIVEAAESPEPMRLRWNQGLKAMSDIGSATIRNLADSVHGGCENLTQSEYAAFQKAKLIADPRNGGDWKKAKRILEEAGFEVYWV